VVAAAVFNGTYLVIAIFFSILWHHAVRSGLLDAATLESANSISRQYAIGPLAYLACLGLTWISIPGSIAGNVILAVFFAVPPKTQRNTQLAMHSATK
jgi:hypothetical protein